MVKKTIIIILIFLIGIFVSMAFLYYFKVIKENNIMKKSIEDFLSNKETFIKNLFDIEPRKIVSISQEELQQILYQKKAMPLQIFKTKKNELLNSISDREKYPILYYHHNKSNIGEALYLILDLENKHVLSVLIYYKNVFDLIFKK